MDSPVDEVVEQMHVTTDGHTIRPDGRAGRSIVADRDRTGQVLTNLLANAVTFPPVDGDVVVATAVDFAGVSVTVCDHGMGIRADRQAREFDRFHRISEPLTDGSPSLGPGLFISAEIIRRHGGRLWMESQEGLGPPSGFGSRRYPPMDEKTWLNNRDSVDNVDAAEETLQFVDGAWRQGPRPAAECDRKRHLGASPGRGPFRTSRVPTRTVGHCTRS